MAPSSHRLSTLRPLSKCHAPACRPGFSTQPRRLPYTLSLFAYFRCTKSVTTHELAPSLGLVPSIAFVSGSGLGLYTQEEGKSGRGIQRPARNTSRGEQGPPPTHTHYKKVVCPLPSPVALLALLAPPLSRSPSFTPPPPKPPR